MKNSAERRAKKKNIEILLINLLVKTVTGFYLLMTGNSLFSATMLLFLDDLGTVHKTCFLHHIKLCCVQRVFPSYILLKLKNFHTFARHIHPQVLTIHNSLGAIKSLFPCNYLWYQDRHIELKNILILFLICTSSNKIRSSNDI